MSSTSRMKIKAIVVLMVLAVACLSSEQKANAQTLAPAACQQFFSASGIPLAGGFLYSYVGGTSTPTPTYADSAATIPNSNPLILNSGGFPVSATGGCGIWLSNSVTYKFVVQNSTHTSQWTVDNIFGNSSAALLSSANTWTMLQTFSGGITGTGNTGALTLGSGALGANTWTGTQTITAGLLPRSIDTATIYADQLTPSSGLCSVTGSDASAKIQCAINLLPANGGVVNAINLQDPGGTGSTIIDPGAKSVTLYLGPYTYQIQQVVLETNFHIIGTGMGAYSTSSPTTILQACSTCAATNSIVLGTNGGNGGATQHVLMDGIRLYGATSDTAIGMNLKTVNGAGTGLWYSTFRNICVGVCGPSGASANGFSGGTIILDGTIASTVNQFLDFYNVQAFKTNGGSYALGLLGANGQINFVQCEFDGPTRNDGTTVVQISNNVSTNTGPYSITFTGSTVQHGTIGVNIAGAQNITFLGTHFETVGQAIQINIGTSSVASTAISFIDSTCQNFCGNASGSGWWAKNLSPSTGTDIKFFGNQIQSSVDAVYVGFSNFQGFTSIGDELSTTSTVNPQPSIGLNIPILTALTTTSGTSDNVTVTGMTSSGHCSLTATNASAATNTATTYVSAKTTNQITVTHTGTASMTYDILCTPN